MMLTIHGFPPNTKYQDVKSLLSQQVNISDYILDNLVGEPDGRTKKVRVGLADDSEGYKLVNTLDGYRIQGFMLKVVPIGKPASKPSSQTFDSRPSYPNQPQNAFPNQQRNEYSNQQRNDFVQPSNDWGPNNRGPHGTGPHNASTQVPAGGPIPRGRPQSQGGPGGPNRPSGPFNQGGPAGPSGPRGHSAGGPPQITIDRSTQWGPNTSANQWGGQNRPMGSQGPQNSLGYNVEPNNNPPYSQQHSNQPSSEMRSFGRPQEQSFGGFPPKNNVSEPMTTRQAPQSNRGRTLRSVETETGGPMHNRFVPVQNYPQHDKPIPIMKDNFQAPSQYTVNSTGGHAPMYQGPGSSAPWPQQGQQNKPIAPFDKQYDQGKYGPERDQGRPGTDMQRRHSPNTRRMSPPGRRISPSGRRFSPPGRRISPSGRKYSPPGRRMSPSGRRMSPPGRMMSPTGRRISPPSRAIPPSGRHSPTARGVPPGRHISPAGKRNSPPVRRISPPGRRLSPSGRRMSPSGRRMSPSGRRISPPLRRMSPSVRRISPSGRRMSPSGRRISPPLRRISPSGRMISLPGRRLSPSDRRISPTGKRISPNDRRLPVHHPARRESPPRRGDIQPRPGMARHDSPPRQPRSSPGRPIDKGTDYEKIKKIRPAYESVPSQAPNQAMYSGGYRPGDHDNVQYPATRPERRSSPWQRDNSAPIKKQDDDRREMARMPPRSDDPTRSHSSTRKSRSPIRRERSPIQPSRFKRLSPSSRSSRSPRRSWALEKRRSPEISDAPPPPIWPGQSSHADEYSRPGRPSFNDRKEDKPKHTPVWERPDGFDRRPDGDHRRPIGDRRQFSDEKVRAALAEREILAVRDSERDRFAPTQPKFSPRDYDAERRDHRHRNSPDRKPRDIDITRRPEHDDRRDDFHHRREPSPLRDKKPAILESIDKDFESIYSRTMQFKKKAEEMRKIHKREGYLEEERSHDRDREDTLRYEDRNRHERDREDRPRFEPRVEDEHRYRSRDENREHIQNTERPLRFHMSPSVRAKREKAIEDIAMKILERSDDYRDVKGEQKLRILEELKLGVARIVYDMFGDSDVSFIEVVVKYQARYNAKDEAQLLEDVIKSLPSHMRVIKRHAPGAAEVPAKLARRSASPTSKAKRSTALKSKPYISKEAVRYHGSAKTKSAMKPESRQPSRTKNTELAELKKQSDADKKADVKTGSSSNVEGHCELNDLMTRTVESELQNIMIRAKEVLPEKTTGDVDHFVVEKLKNQVSDNLRDVIGLNVTKRLLNVHNPLYVKVQFSGKPDKSELREFLKTYNFNGFKRIESAVNMFAAQVRTIADYDRICTTENIRCGSAKVTVIPIYKFSKCPPNLKSPFADRLEKEGDKDTAFTMKDVANEKSTKPVTSTQKPVKTEKVAEESNTSTDKMVEDKTETKPKVENHSEDKLKTEIKAEDKTTGNKSVVAENKATVNTTTAATNKTTDKSKTVPNAPNTAYKPAVVATVTEKPEKKVTTPTNKTTAPANTATVTANKPTVTTNKPTVTTNKPTVTANKPTVTTNKATVTAKNATVTTNKITNTPNKATAKPTKLVENQNKPTVNPSKTPEDKPTVQNKPTVTENKTTATPNKITATSKKTPVNQNKPTALPNKPVTAKAPTKTVANKPTNTKPPVKPAPVKKPIAAPLKTVTPKKSISTPVKQTAKKSNKVENDFDELDDHDILALMSSGIVLDECSGSDDE